MIEECQPLKKQGKFYWTNYDMRRDATEIRLAEIALCGRVFVERVRKKKQHAMWESVCGKSKKEGTT